MRGALMLVCGGAGRRSTLGRLAQAWPPDGAGDGHGGIVGGATLLRCDAVPLLSDTVAPSTSAGMATAVASFHSALAVGMSGGAVFVYMPRGLASDGAGGGCAPAPCVIPRSALFAPAKMKSPNC